MAAVTKTGTRAAAGIPVGGAGPANAVHASWGTVTVEADSEDGDIFKVCKLPAGATVLSGHIISTDGDTGIESLDIDIGWAATDDEVADPDGFGNLGVWTGDTSPEKPLAGTYINFAGVLTTVGPKTFTAAATIQLETNAAAATGVAMEVTVVVYYVFNAT